MISNAQWQTVARNIERTAANWSDGAVGGGMLARGHSDGSADDFGRTGMNSMLAADADDNNGYAGTGESAADLWDLGPGSSGGEQRRTFILSNGEVVWEWVSSTVLGSSLSPSLAVNAWHEYSDVAYFPAGSENRALFGPAGPYDSGNGMGFLYGGTAGMLARGHWGSGGLDAAYAGVFSIGLNGASGPDKTFRCVFQ